MERPVLQDGEKLKGRITGTVFPWATLHIGYEGADAHSCGHS